MNIAFFLLPKQQVMHIPQSATLRQTLERMEHHRYTAVPILDQDGKYVGTVTEGDLLWHMKNNDLSFDQIHKVKLSEVPLRMSNHPVHVNANIRDLISLVKVQNFVPVIDDLERFIGIVRRSDVIDYCEKNMWAGEPSGLL
ncbi:CBS domain-containing protein [Paenibacillus sp. PR3]|uniref:CBS domain-containing protein n=1 Tax=Paenibacillus terricola TaxID=2763503 RepID=A0ABR8MYZ8_9BACL|nr:CBS domain-containing protein [Paenibacillus terricola]MBD3920302.1 CBS domain-containing protein [Paenibacillus terricola]